MLRIQEPITKALIIYLIMIGYILIKQPLSMFKEDGTLKSFGIRIDEDETLFSLHVVFILLAVVIFFFSVLI